MVTGIQVSSLKPLLTTPEQVYAAFAEIASMGCTTVQLQWIDPTVPVPSIKESLSKYGITSVSVQDFYDAVHEDLGYYVNLNAATGGTWLCVSRIPERLKSRDGLDAYIGELRDLQEKLTPLGQRLCFHPVSGDFSAISGVNAVEYLLENMPELELCLDLYHLNRCCGNMPGFIRRYAGRICMVHFKDSIGGSLVPAGQGSVNWAGVMEACLDAGVSYGFAEQETWDRNPFDCLKDALHWIHEQL